MNKRGVLITFEGIEGCGKTTQMGLLAEHLRSLGRDVLVTKEPGGTSIGQKIRRIILSPDHIHMAPVCEALLYLADRAQHNAEVIVPALSDGKWILCDRYQDSTRAYQGAARGVGRAQLDAIFDLATGGLEPDLTFLLDLEAEEGLTRARKRNDDCEHYAAEGRFEEEDLAFHTEVRASFHALAEAEPDRFRLIDAARASEAVAEDVAETLEQWMAARF